MYLTFNVLQIWLKIECTPKQWRNCHITFVIHDEVMLNICIENWKENMHTNITPYKVCMR